MSAGTLGGAMSGTTDPAIEQRLDQLMHVSLFRGLSPEQLHPLAEAAVLVDYAPGAALVTQGEPGESVYVIVSGQVEVRARSDQDSAADEAVVALLGAGDAVGELALLDGEPRSATCVAIEDTMCLRLERSDFYSALQRHWPLNRELFIVLAKRLRMADRLLAEHARDPLTGLNNRRALHELYEREAARSQRASRRENEATTPPMAVLFADVDDFKQINDNHGHRVGDEVLRAVAQALTSVSRTTDIVVRYGGDEFVMLLPEAGQDGAERVAQRLREIVAEQPPGPVPFSLSIGTAVAENPLLALEQLLEQADRAMYTEKARRRHSHAAQA